MFPTFDRIKELAKKQGLSINLLEEKLGYNQKGAKKELKMEPIER